MYNIKRVSLFLLSLLCVAVTADSGKAYTARDIAQLFADARVIPANQQTELQRALAELFDNLHYYDGIFFDYLQGDINLIVLPDNCHHYPTELLKNILDLVVKDNDGVVEGIGIEDYEEYLQKLNENTQAQCAPCKLLEEFYIHQKRLATEQVEGAKKRFEELINKQ